MFYSHAVLTSREHGVATVWLVATLGSNSSLRTVTRRKILNVDVHKACDTIQNPEAPMALRLQGNLLYGVARVYSQQCGYVLADAQAVRDKVRGVPVIMKEFALDTEAGRAKPDQLNLPDDPAFLPELDLNFNLSAFELPLATSGRSSLMSPPSLASVRSSQQAEADDQPSLELSPPDVSLGAGPGGFEPTVGPGISSVGRTSGLSVLAEDSGIVDVGWEFDEHGNIVDTTEAAKPPIRASAIEEDPGIRIAADSGISARVRQEHAESLQTAQQGLEFDNGIFNTGEDDDTLPVAQATSPHPQAGRTDTAEPVLSVSSVENEEKEMLSAVTFVAHRRAIAARSLKFDERPVLTNDELRQWNEAYIENMQEAVNAKHPYKLTHQAKKNAEHWVLGQGIGSVGSRPGPLKMFSGTALVAALTGRKLSAAGTKHARAASISRAGEEGERRVRNREGESQQIGRGANEQDLALTGQDEGIFIAGDDTDVEIGRTAPEELIEQRSSQTPWGVFSASRRGLASRFGSATPRMTPSGGGLALGFEFGPPSALSGRGSRITTASPLQGRGPPLTLSQRISIISTPDRERLVTIDAPKRDEGKIEGELPSLGDESEEFQLYGPAAAVDTQTAAQNQWIAAALDSESRNFLDFLDAHVQAQALNAAELQEAESKIQKGTVAFERLLPPSNNTKMVAAQAFLHVLTLASKDMVTVRQDKAFEDIELAIALEA